MNNNPSAAGAALFDSQVVCPVTGEAFSVCDGSLISASGRRYPLQDGIPLLYVDEHFEGAGAVGPSQDAVTHAVKDFYEDAPFPNYNRFDNLNAFVRQADAGIFARLLRHQIPPNSSVLEIGCGTGQLSNYLAATTLSRVYGADMTVASLKLAHGFAERNAIEGVRFVQANLFCPPFKPESMDIVIANGVLHHTYDTKKAFMSISRLVKPGGHIIIGLYNHIGRLWTDWRRLLVGFWGERILFLDPHLRSNLSPDKRRAWIRDQYFHPQERKHSMSELIRWFEEAGFCFVSSIPKILGVFQPDEQLFKLQKSGTHFDRLSAEIGILFSSLGKEGGLFICIGKKQACTLKTSTTLER